MKTPLPSLAAGATRLLSRLAPTAYHFWFYHSHPWDNVTWMGVPAHKLPLDMWNYQEILATLRPSLVIEFVTFHGGSALFFATVMRQIGNRFRLLSVDIDGSLIQESARRDPDIEFLKSSSSDPQVAKRITELKAAYPGQVFAILDSDHSKSHVLAEMTLLRPLLSPGDYLIVEDSNVNGHPVLRAHGPGPWEAIDEYVHLFPDDYTRDLKREQKFGLTYAPTGYLVRKSGTS